MSIIGKMVSRMILVRFLAVLFGISIFVLTLEVISYSKEILAMDSVSDFKVLRYLAFRLPLTLSTFMTISFLLALLLTLAELSYRNETTAIFAGGISPARLIIMLLPLSIGVGVLHFLVADRGIPAAAPTLRQWGIGDYGEKQLKIGERDPIWMRSGSDILRAGKANAGSTVLHDVYIFHRDRNGVLLSQIMARSARLTKGIWNLEDVTVVDVGEPLPKRAALMTYEGTVRPAEAGSRSGDPEEMTMGDLSYFVENSGFGIRPTYVYTTWWHKRLAPLLTGVLMAAICVPLASRFRRGGGLGVLFLAGVGLGFLFFIMDGLFVSAGELGFVAPVVAAWFPSFAFGLLALTLVLRSERA